MKPDMGVEYYKSAIAGMYRSYAGFKEYNKQHEVKVRISFHPNKELQRNGKKTPEQIPRYSLTGTYRGFCFVNLTYTQFVCPLLRCAWLTNLQSFD